MYVWACSGRRYVDGLHVSYLPCVHQRNAQSKIKMTSVVAEWTFSTSAKQAQKLINVSVYSIRPSVWNFATTEYASRKKKFGKELGGKSPSLCDDRSPFGNAKKRRDACRPVGHIIRGNPSLVDFDLNHGGQQFTTAENCEGACVHRMGEKRGLEDQGKVEHGRCRKPLL